MRSEWPARLPAVGLASLPFRLHPCLPLCLPAGTGAYRQERNGTVGIKRCANGGSDRESGGKGGRTTPQAATSEPNAATHRRSDTTLAKVPFLCSRNGRHAFLPSGWHPCPPACLPACPRACLPAERHKGRTGCRTASLFARAAACQTMS
ncbi:hypothetical protein [Bacteroides uniformis]|uniref:hypothetical protein n=1 Tax=Bacteroides uniformis TaxID=820 RepID=UPI001C378F9D|nr:hypothetical protein [Bacteroides uniformis]MBV3483841.1 hypothetical protein [Bacteroides uniformis]MBV3504589.1 hypothetical protein [Bacteroides uniformis]MBV3536311.1 hypothetical protein [Bacteroides uniformis]MBV3548350.1 hypothetical protein [Bacteroides uniformis]MBV3552398.1 hypothetical protein [Bacteroides uniformis]